MMTGQYFESDFVNLYYYKFGTGKQHMLCFHGYGMHGRQFALLEKDFGEKYTFWGFDLFFHEKTTLKDQSLAYVKAGIRKKQLGQLFKSFCDAHGIERFSVLGYSMGSHYATVVVEQLPQMVNEYIVVAPSSVNPGPLLRFFGINNLGNKVLEKLMLSERAMLNLIKLSRRFRLIDDVGRDVLFKEMGTHQLRFAFYACFVYLRFLATDEKRLIEVVETFNIRTMFIFGKRDKMYLPKIGDAFFAKLDRAEIVILDADHDMVKPDFVAALRRLLL